MEILRTSLDVVFVFSQYLLKFVGAALTLMIIKVVADLYYIKRAEEFKRVFGFRLFWAENSRVNNAIAVEIKDLERLEQEIIGVREPMFLDILQKKIGEKRQKVLDMERSIIVNHFYLVVETQNMFRTMQRHRGLAN